MMLAVLALLVSPASAGGKGKKVNGNGFAATRNAAQRGNSDAAFRLALMYLNGTGTPRNRSEAARYMKMAAERGHQRAQYYLGTFYYEGTGVKEDRQAAALWIRKAAEGGDAEAQYAYGMLLLSGDGVPVDKVTAMEWLGKASRQGNQGARDVLQELVTFSGRPPEIRSLEPDLSAKRPDATQGEAVNRERLEGKGVILNQGEFSLKFSMPDLSGANSPYRTSPDDNLRNRLQGGTFEIIYRPAE
ncbi:MAG: sel1 repeat family protein [Desulfuromonadales bacterium]|nr:MAG: sel1 repeat family protein [Desulfuromonadales bacterium]